MLLPFPTSIHRQYAAAETRQQTLAGIADHEWADRQLEALRGIWADATADIPYYASLVASGRAPRVIETWAELQSLPLLTRQLLQERPSEFLRRSGPPESFMKTAGSTGLPLRIGMNQAERDHLRVVKLSAWQSLGYTQESRLFLIWGHAHLLGTGWRGQISHLKRKASDTLLGYRRVDAYRLNRETCEAHAKTLIRFRPLGVIGYAAALDLFARYTEGYRDQFRALGVRFVLATAEAPPRPDTVSRLTDLFGCPVVQEYGGAEFGQVAFKRGAEPFEVYHDLNYLECLQPGAGDDGASPAIVTTLYPRYLPLIRYQVGDALLGTDRLPHGHVRRFDAVAGRINDVIALDGGDSIHSVAIFHCIHQEPQVHSIQVVLTDSGVELHLVALDGDREAMEQRIRGRLAQVHPALGTARFTYVEDLQTSRAGKRRWFIDQRTTIPCVASPAS